MIEKMLHETRISITDLAREQDVSVPTAWRWCTKGVRNCVLASFSCGGRKYTTREAFARWISALNGEPIRSETPQQYEQQLERAERRAQELGV